MGNTEYKGQAVGAKFSQRPPLLVVFSKTLNVFLA